MWIWTWGCRSHKTVVLKVHMMINHWIHVRQFNSQINLSGGGPANFLGQFLDVRVSRFHDHHVWWLRGGDILSRSTYQACSEPSISLVVKFRCTNVGFFFRIEASRYVLTIFFSWGEGTRADGEWDEKGSCKCTLQFNKVAPKKILLIWPQKLECSFKDPPFELTFWEDERRSYSVGMVYGTYRSY